MPTLTTEAFAYMTVGKNCITQMLSFVTNLYVVYSMQNIFPEYFGASQPGWFKKLLPLRLVHEKNMIELRIAASCAEELNVERDRKISVGMKYGFLSNAHDNAVLALTSAQENARYLCMYVCVCM
jgi:hypothetical protein